MNRWRRRSPDHVAKSRPDDDSGSTDAELTAVASSIWHEADTHRQRIIEKDKAARARRKSGRRG